MRMRAVCKVEPKPGAELIEIDMPEPEPDEVLVKIKAASICGTDVHIYEWNKWASERVKRFPQIMGHEFCGEIVKTGREAKRLKVGDYVSAETHIPCNNCIQCLSGQQHLCKNLKILSLDTDGAFSEYIAIPEVIAWKNDKSIPPEFASIEEPLGNAVYATTVHDLIGRTVAIFGDGPIGLFSVGIARLSGAALIFCVGLNPVRLKIAEKMGADFALNNNEIDTVSFIMEKTEGNGVDVVLEMAGVQETIDQGLKVLRKGGAFSAFGITPDSVNVDINNGIIFKGATIYGINGREMFNTWVKTTNLLKYKRLDISPVITHKFKLEDFKKGFELMMAIPKVSGKIVLFP
ncbi:MAG: L-threonine 3-dehydrogenase [Acidobacteriota bacterium]